MLFCQLILPVDRLCTGVVPRQVIERLPSAQNCQGAFRVKLQAYRSGAVAKSLVWEKFAPGQGGSAVRDIKTPTVKLNHMKVFGHKRGAWANRVDRIKTELL